MDRSWISDPKLSKSYKNGVEEFLKFASQNPPEVGKLDCPCNRCRNNARLKRNTVRKHLLKHGFDSDYTQWVCHGEIVLTVCSSDGSSELTVKTDGDVNRVNDSKPTEEPGDSAGHPKHAKDKGKNIEVPDQGPDDQKISTAALQPREIPWDDKILILAYYLYKLRKKYGWDGESFDYLISTLLTLFPQFNSLPKRFNFVWNAYEAVASNASSSSCGSSSWESIKEQLDRMRWKCYACGQALKPDVIFITASQRTRRSRNRRRNRRKLPPKNDA